MSKIYLNSEEAWNLLCKTVFEYHENQINKLSEIQQISYLQELSELEFKIYFVFKLDGVVNLELVLHEDFPKVWNFFKNKLNWSESKFECTECGTENKDYIGMEQHPGKNIWSQGFGGDNVCGISGYTLLSYSDCKKCGNNEFRLVKKV